MRTPIPLRSVHPRSLTAEGEEMRGPDAELAASRQRAAARRASKPHYAVNPWLLAGATTLCLSLAAWFIPRDQELLARLLQDGEQGRAMEFAMSHGGQVVLKAGDVPNLPAASREEEQEMTRSALQTALAQESAVDPGLLGDAIRYYGKLDPAVEMVRAHLARLMPAARQECYSALADICLGQSDTKRAASLLNEAASQGLENEVLLRKRAQSLVWSEQPREAAAALEAWSSQHTLPPDLVEQRIACLQAANQTAEALDAALAGLGGDKSLSSLKRAITVAAAAGEVAKVIPAVEEALAAFPETKASLEDLKAGKPTASPEWQDLAKSFARGCEWGGQQDKAMDFHLKLAALGDFYSFERVEDLNKRGINRRGDFMRLLRVLLPIPGRPDLELTAAGLMADSGQYADAVRTYKSWLEKNPKDIEARAQLAATYDEMSDMDSALAMYEEVLRLDPGNLNSRKEKADILIGFKNFRGALEVYKKFLSHEHDTFTLENYALLAESLADYASRAHALSLRHKVLKAPTSKDYYDIARAYLVLQDHEKAISYLLEGRRRHPASRLVWLTLARAYSNAERPDEAMALLRRPETKSDMEALMIYIDAAATRQEFEAAFHFLGLGIEEKFAFGPETLLPLSSIYYHNGHRALAAKLLQGIPEDDSSLYALMAKTCYEQADYAKAESFQRQHLDHLRLDDATAWVTLGDICKLQGKLQEADDAYLKARQLMVEKMNRATAAAPQETAETPDAKSEAEARRSTAQVQ